MTLTLSNVLWTPAVLADDLSKDVSVGTTKLAEFSSAEFKPNLLVLNELKSTYNASIRLDITVGTFRFQTLTGTQKMLLRTDDFLSIKAVATAAASLTASLQLILTPFSVPDKILLGKPLTEEERRIAEKFDLEAEIQEGAFLTYEELFSRIFKPVRIRSLHLESGTHSFTAFADRFPQLLGFEVPAGKTLKITADEQEVASITPVSDFSASVRISALRKLILECNDTFKATIADIKLTRYLKMLFGLMTKEEDEELWQRTKALV